MALPKGQHRGRFSVFSPKGRIIDEHIEPSPVFLVGIPVDYGVKYAKNNWLK